MPVNIRRNIFERLASSVDRLTARPVAFAAACGLVLAWAVTGPVFGFSDTWQLVINTGTTVVTFLMVFLLQNSQSRAAERDRAVLDEIKRIVVREEHELHDLEEDLGRQ